MIYLKWGKRLISHGNKFFISGHNILFWFLFLNVMCKTPYLQVKEILPVKYNLSMLSWWLPKKSSIGPSTCKTEQKLCMSRDAFSHYLDNLETFTAKITNIVVFNLEHVFKIKVLRTVWDQMKFYWILTEYFTKHEKISLCVTLFCPVVLQCHLYYCTLYVNITRGHWLQ